MIYKAWLPAKCRVLVTYESEERLSDAEIKERLLIQGQAPEYLCDDCTEDFDYNGEIDEEAAELEDVEYTYENRH